jgi:ferritin-like metal-binding protein YciE
MTEKKLSDLFYDTLKDIYFAERQILKSLPKMAKAAKSQELKAAFLTHRDETEVHVERLQQIFEIVGKRAQAKTCEAIMVLAGGQAAEHDEMSRYGTLKTRATQPGMRDAAALLDQTLHGERKTDALLSRLPQAKVDLKAA